VEHLTEATDFNIQPLFDQYIQQGQTIEYASTLLPPGLKTYIEPNGACYFALDADKLAELGVFLKK
jgi:hypothetical protein